MNWASGNFLFPTSTGAFTVTGLDFQPQMLFFIGTNNATEDVLVASANPGMFFGMTWLDYLTGLPDSQSVSLIMNAGINVKPDPIVMAATLGCDVDYAASLTSLNPTGFTLNVTNAASANRPITWLAGGAFDDAEGSANLATAVYNIGWKALAAFMINYRTSGGIRDGCESGQYTSLYLGCASYPKVDAVPTYGDRSWGSGGTSRFQITGVQGFTKAKANITPNPQFNSAINISTGDFPPIVIEDRIYFYRSSDTEVTSEPHGGPLRFMVQWWSGEAWCNSFIPAQAQGGLSVFTSGNAFLNDIEAAIYVGVLGPDAEGLSATSRLAIGLMARDQEQGVVAANRDGYMFQSRSMSVCDIADASGVHAASGVIDGDHIDFTTELNTSGTGSLGDVFVFGGQGTGWLPQIYRRWPH